jgi:hypothetical protein
MGAVDFSDNDESGGQSPWPISSNDDEDQRLAAAVDQAAQTMADIADFAGKWDKEDHLAAEEDEEEELFDGDLGPPGDPDTDLRECEVRYLELSVEEHEARVDAIKQRMQTQKDIQDQILKALCVSRPAPETYVVMRRLEATRAGRRAAMKRQRRILTRAERQRNEWRRRVDAAQKQREEVQTATEGVPDEGWQWSAMGGAWHDVQVPDSSWGKSWEICPLANLAMPDDECLANVRRVALELEAEARASALRRREAEAKRREEERRMRRGDDGSEADEENTALARPPPVWEEDEEEEEEEDGEDRDEVQSDALPGPSESDSGETSAVLRMAGGAHGQDGASLRRGEPTPLRSGRNAGAMASAGRRPGRLEAAVPEPDSESEAIPVTSESPGDEPPPRATRWRRRDVDVMAGSDGDWEESSGPIRRRGGRAREDSDDDATPMSRQRRGVQPGARSGGWRCSTVEFR